MHSCLPFSFPVMALYFPLLSTWTSLSAKPSLASTRSWSCCHRAALSKTLTSFLLSAGQSMTSATEVNTKQNTVKSWRSITFKQGMVLLLTVQMRTWQLNPGNESSLKKKPVFYGKVAPGYNNTLHFAAVNTCFINKLTLVKTGCFAIEILNCIFLTSF